MQKTRRLLRREITYASAKEKEVNILHQLGYYDKQTRFFSRLNSQHDWIKKTVAHHLNLSTPAACRVADMDDWMHGSFNVCIPVTINEEGKRVLMRLPLPYRVGEEFMSGNCDEKVRCEAGTYAWLQENLPRCANRTALRVYSLKWRKCTFTQLENLPLVPRWIQLLRRQLCSWLGYPIPSKYIPHRARNGKAVSGYLLLEYIEPSRGAMLSNTWNDNQYDITLRSNLFRGLSRIFLSISRIPLPRIGSFVVDHDGFLVLSNRPLSIEIQQLENEEIPTGIRRDYTYSTVDSYVADILTFHDNRVRYQPNVVNDLGDLVHQLASLSAMRTVSKSFFQKELCRGPFILSLTDLHQSNIFVDQNWNITCLVDLEWACSRPIEMIRPPHWLTNKGVDQLVSSEYDEVRKELIHHLVAEERRSSSTPAEDKNHHPPLLSDIMNKTWKTGTFWYTLALSSPSGLFTIFQEHIRPLFCTQNIEEFNLIMPFLWEQNVARIAIQKLSDKEEYDRKLESQFENNTDELYS